MSSQPTLSTRDRDRLPGDPDFRAFFGGRRLRVVPWHRSLRGCLELSVDEEAPVFDLWRSGEALLARQHGTFDAAAEIERLRRWAGEEAGAGLEVGSPLAPRSLA